eukprot:gene29798-35978_t
MTSNASLLTKAQTLLAKSEVVEAVYVSNVIDELLKNVQQLSRQEFDVLSLLFLKMLDRLFGEETTTVKSEGADAAAPSSSSSTGWAKTPPGGWLRAMGASTSSSTPIFSLSRSFPDLDQLPSTSSLRLLKHFLPHSALLGVLRGELQWSLALLPPKIHMLISGHPSYPLLASPSHSRLLQLLSSA